MGIASAWDLTHSRSLRPTSSRASRRDTLLPTCLLRILRSKRLSRGCTNLQFHNRCRKEAHEALSGNPQRTLSHHAPIPRRRRGRLVDTGLLRHGHHHGFRGILQFDRTASADELLAAGELCMAGTGPAGAVAVEPRHGGTRDGAQRRRRVRTVPPRRPLQPVVCARDGLANCTDNPPSGSDDRHRDGCLPDHRT